MRDSTLKMLAAMAEGWQAQTADMVDLAVATVMRNNGLRSLTITTDDMHRTSSKFDITRRLWTTANGGAAWTFTIKEKPNDKQGELEVTSKPE